MRTNQGSRVDNRAASYTNVGAVYNAPVNTTVVHDKSVTYEVDPDDTETLERFSMFLMRHLGEKKTVASAVVSAVVALASYVGWYNLTVQALFYVGVAFTVVAAALWVAVQYKHTTRCQKCNTFYAMKETGSPTVREVRAEGGTRQTTTRSFDCRFCGNQVRKKSNAFIADEPDEA